MESVTVTAEQLEAARHALELFSKVASSNPPPPDVLLSEAL